MTDKYINRKWVDTKMKHDPLYLFENKREKFDKWLKKKTGEYYEPEQPVIKKNASAPVPKAVEVQATIPKMPEMGDLISFGMQ